MQHLIPLRVIQNSDNSVLFVARARSTTEIVAVKCPKEGWAEAAERELKFFMRLPHQSVLPPVAIYYDCRPIITVFPYLDGGDLFDAILNGWHATEDVIKLIMWQLLEALAFYDDHGVWHRDIKPENLMLMQNGRLKVIDFNCAFDLHGKLADYSPAGSPRYFPPEIRRGLEFSSQMPREPAKADVWSAGITFAFLLSGTLPEMFQMFSLEPEAYFQAGFPHIEECEELSGRSELAKDLLAKMLVANPDNRLSPREAMSHPWFDYEVNRNRRGI
jgi:5'-AMP-activated protein kinase catalytic alpha subunit